MPLPHSSLVAHSNPFSVIRRFARARLSLLRTRSRSVFPMLLASSHTLLPFELKFDVRNRIL